MASQEPLQEPSQSAPYPPNMAIPPNMAQYNYYPAVPQTNFAYPNAYPNGAPTVPAAYYPYPPSNVPTGQEIPPTAPPFQFGQAPPPNIPVMVVPMPAPAPNPTLDRRNFSSYVCLGILLTLLFSPIISLFSLCCVRDPVASLFLRRGIGAGWIIWGVALIIPGCLFVNSYITDCKTAVFESNNVNTTINITSDVCNPLPTNTRQLGRSLLGAGIFLVICGFIFIRISVRQWRRILRQQNTGVAAPQYYYPPPNQPNQ